MAQAKVEIIVQDQQVDKLRGKLVELQRGLKIQYDIDGRPIDIVIDKSLNLQKQLRLLTAELRKTKEGSLKILILMLLFHNLKKILKLHLVLLKSEYKRDSIFLLQ